MISFEEALKTVLENADPRPVEHVNLENANGRILAGNIHSDMDMPPFNKSAVDGFACRSEDVISGRELTVLETVPAGSLPHKTTGPGECSRIMTGSMVPSGADMVVMVEHTTMTSAEKVKIIKTTNNRNICYLAEDIRSGQQVISRGARLKPAHIAVLAAVGCSGVDVFAQPKVGILSTGNELVEPSLKPEGAQIRNSNSWQLQAQALNIPVHSRYFGIAGDSSPELQKKMSEALSESDVLLLTGGVSMGDFDHVPGVMEQIGAKILFKSIAIQPGRPTVFAKADKKFIFGLPGNPVSAFVLFEILVKPFLLAMMGCREKPLVLTLPMGTEFGRKSAQRKSVVPVVIREGRVFPVEYHGSAHINVYTEASGMMFLETGQLAIGKGEPVDVRLL